MARVQTISESGIKTVPSQYIQPISTRPESTPSRSLVPTFDLSSPSLPLLNDICTQWGAFHLTNHSVPLPLLRRIRQVSLSFFHNPSLPYKLTYSSSSPTSQGYSTNMLLNDASVLDWRDFFNHHTLPLSRRDTSCWPDSPPDYKDVLVEYSEAMHKLAKRLMGWVGESLGLGGGRIEEAVGEIYQNVTASYYPPCPQPDLTLGLQAHSDFGAMTLLVQDDVGGIEVLKDGEWVSVQPLEDAILVILGDQTEVITNGKYRSAVHRAVTNGSRSRLSVATFHDPAKTREISPVFDPPKYRPVLYGDYVTSWYTKGPEGKRNIDALLL